MNSRTLELHTYVKLLTVYVAFFCATGRYYRAAWNATRSYDEISVCPSVRPSDVWIVIKRKKNQSRFLYHAKEHSL